MTTINLEEILDAVIDRSFTHIPKSIRSDFQLKMKDNGVYRTCINAMKDACLETIIKCADNAKTVVECDDDFNEELTMRTIVDSDSILNTKQQIRCK